MTTPLDNACDDLGDALNAVRKVEATFYDLFINTELFFISDGKPTGKTQNTIKVSSDGESWDTPVVEEDGNKFVMLFDSQQRAADWAGREVEVVGAEGLAILNSIKLDDKTYIMLNENTEHWKEFTPDEIQWLMDNIEEDS